MDAWDYILVYILALLAGGWAVSAGVTFGLNPVGVYVAAVLGSLTFGAVVLFGGGPIRDRLMAQSEAASRLESQAEDRAGPLIQRWGMRGLALIGPTVLGPSITLTAALLFGFERRRFAMWYTASTLLGFAVLTLFWVLVTG